MTTPTNKELYDMITILQNTVRQFSNDMMSMKKTNDILTYKNKILESKVKLCMEEDAYNQPQVDYCETTIEELQGEQERIDDIQTANSEDILSLLERVDALEEQPRRRTIRIRRPVRPPAYTTRDGFLEFNSDFDTSNTSTTSSSSEEAPTLLSSSEEETDTPNTPPPQWNDRHIFFADE